MRCSLALLCFSPLVAMAGIVVNCPTPNLDCGYYDLETAVGNTGTIDFGGWYESTVPGIATFTLDRSFVTHGPPRLGAMRLTFRTDDDGNPSPPLVLATATGDGLGYSCTSVVGFGNICYNDSLVWVDLGQLLPVHMQVQVSRFDFYVGDDGGGYGTVFLQAQFFEVDPETFLPGAPVAVYFVPEPGSIWLSGAGFIAAGMLLRKKRSSNLRGEWPQK